MVLTALLLEWEKEAEDLEICSSLALTGKLLQKEQYYLHTNDIFLKHPNQNFPLAWAKLASLMMPKDVVQSGKDSGHYILGLLLERAT